MVHRPVANFFDPPGVPNCDSGGASRPQRRPVSPHQARFASAEATLRPGGNPDLFAGPAVTTHRLRRSVFLVADRLVIERTAQSRSFSFQAPSSSTNFTS
jgi:hypothetical protein